MARLYMILITTLLFLGGCSTKNIRIGGMMCPEGYTQEQINQDLSECRFYGEQEQREAQKAAFPKEVQPECIECLEAKGYELTE